MASDATIIVGSLNDKELRNAIDNLVKMVDDKMLEAAQSFDAGISLMEQSLRRFSTNAATTVNDIKQEFTKLGTTFDDFAKAMAKATTAASGGGRGAGGAGGGSGTSSGSAGGSTAASGTVRELEQRIAKQKEIVGEQKLSTNELQKEVDLHGKLKGQLKEELKTTEQRRAELAKSRLGRATIMPTGSLDEANQKLRMLEILQRRYASGTELSVAQQKRLATAISQTKREIDRMKNAQPPTMKQVLGMDESSVEAVSRKMAALKRIRVDTANPAEAKKLGDEYQRLSRLQAEMLGKNIQLTHSNNYLAQSFGYIRNRIVYAFTLGAITNFTKQLYEVRGAYEMLERSLGILVNDMERGTQIFNELNEMALKSPFTLIELGTAAKQLTAYNFTAEEVVDTTRRLADISAALGVPMERLTYNLGQIKAQGVLNARDARDFANAGLAIVPMLAQMYNETKRFGDQQVTTAQVYDMMSKKMVTYRDVLNVIYRITDEGGKFFDFQAKQAGTLRVQIANLSLAYNNMLNDIGKEHQDALAMPLRTMRWVLQNWRELYKIIEAVIVILGIYKAQALVAFTITKAEAAITAFKNLGGAIGMATNAVRLLTAAMATNPLGAIAALAASAAAGFILFGNSVEDVSEDVKKFGDNAVKSIQDVDTYLKILNGVDKQSNTYKQTIEKLNEVLRDYGIETIKEGENLDKIKEKRKEVIALIREEGAERQFANQMAAGTEKYNKSVDAATQKMTSSLKNAMTANAIGFLTENQEITKNADAISAIVAEIVQDNIMLIAGKTGEEYKKGMATIFAQIRESMKEIGISEETLQKAWQDDTLFLHNNIILDYIENVNKAKNANINFTNAITKHHEEGRKAANSTMTLTEKINAYDRALQNPTNDTYALYNSIARLVKDFAKTHNIDFNVRFHAQVPPEWMRAKDLPELQALARRFAAIAQANPNGANVNGTRFTSEELWDRAYNYAQVAKEKEDALQGEAAREKERQKEAEKERKKQEQAARQAAADEKKRQREAAAQQKRDEDMVAKALKDEISLIKEMQGNYDKLRKAGLTNTQALDIATQGYERTIQGINAQLTKFGITAFDAKDFAGKDVNELLTSLKSQLNTLMSSGKVKRDSVKTLELEIQKLAVEAKTYNLKKVTDGLNNELGKLKEEYELAVELDADPELGSIFADMFDLNVDQLPHSINEYAERVTVELNKALKERGDNIQLPTIYLTKDDIDAFRKMSEGGKLNTKSFEEIQKAYQYFVSLRKKAATDVSKIASDYIREYGDLSAQIQQIEIEKNDALMKLNEIYNTDALRQTQRYLDAKFAIEDGAKRKQAKATFDALKKEADYERFFTAIDTLTKKDALSIKNKIKKGIIDAFKDGGLTISQFRKEIKALEEQFDKLSQPTSNWISYLNGGFDKLIQKARETGQEIETIGEKISITGKVDEKDKNYLQSLGNIFSNGKGGTMDFTSLMNKFGGNMKGLGDAVSQAGQGMQAGASGFAGAVTIVDAIIRNVHQTVQAIGSVIDELDSVRNEDNKISNAYWEGFKKFDNYAMSGWENLKSGNVAGAIGDTANSIISVFNTFSNAKNEKINKQIKESERTVKDLENAYKNLSAAIDDSLGNAEIKARRAAVENKKLQLAELERQLQLEQSRSSKRRDEDRIKELQGQIIDAKNEIKDLTAEITSTLLGNDIKSAAEDFVSTWVSAWRQGEDTMDALNKKFDGMIDNMIAKAVASYLVSKRLKRIFDAVDEMTSEKSEGGAEITMNELKRIKNLIGDKSIAEQINQDLTNLYGALDIAYGVDKNLSALQQGIQSITEDTAGALEGYMNGVSQQVYLQSDLLTQIRDAVVTLDNDVTMATQAQMLLQLQNNYILMQTMASLMNGWTTPSGQGIRVELIN